MKKSWILALIAIIALILVCVIAITSSSNVEVSFDSLGGTKVETIKVKKGSTITKPENPTKEGYSFIAWMLDGEEFYFDKNVYTIVSCSNNIYEKVIDKYNSSNLYQDDNSLYMI